MAKLVITHRMFTITHCLRSYKRHLCTIPNKTKPKETVVLGEAYPVDSLTNVKSSIIGKLGKNLHTQKHHPLGLIRLQIQNYFYKTFTKRGNPIFSVYDNLSPVVTPEQNFDNLLVPKDHVSRKISDSYYVNSTHMLRAHMTAHQKDLIKTGLNNFLFVGDVYRRDEIDSSHYPVFHQLDGVRLFSKHELFSDKEFLSLFEEKYRTDQKQSVHTLEAAMSVSLDLKNTLEGLAVAMFGNGMIHAGIGETYVNSLLTTMGLPAISAWTVKKMERRVGPYIEVKARKTCSESRKEEYDIALCQRSESNQDEITFAMSLLDSPTHPVMNVSMSHNNSGYDTCHASTTGPYGDTPSNISGISKDEEKMDITISQDAVWSKRGKAMNSLSDIEMRWVDAYFPFTHPSWELEIMYQGNWLEVLGCGVIEQDILQTSGASEKIGWAFGMGLERLAMKLYDIPDIRLFWSNDSGFLNQFKVDEPSTPVTYKAISVYPQCTLDISFWIPESFEPNDFFDVVRSVGGDLIEHVENFDIFQNPKTKRTSHAYRITYRHMEKTLTKEEVNLIHDEIRQECVEQFGVELR